MREQNYSRQRRRNPPSSPSHTYTHFYLFKGGLLSGQSSASYSHTRSHLGAAKCIHDLPTLGFSAAEEQQLTDEHLLFQSAPWVLKQSWHKCLFLNHHIYVDTQDRGGCGRKLARATQDHTRSFSCSIIRNYYSISLIVCLAALLDIYYMSVCQKNLSSLGLPEVSRFLPFISIMYFIQRSF